MRGLTLRLRRRDTGKYLCGYILLMPFFFGLCIDLLGLPGSLRYTVDLAWVMLVLMALKRGRLRLRRQLIPMAVTVGLFFLITGLWIPVRYRSGLWYLWGVRNYFRFYAAFFAFAGCLTAEDAGKLLRVLDRLFWIHVAVSLIQFCMGYQQDYLGGIFGVERGRSAGYVFFFFTIVLSRSMLDMMAGRESVGACLARCAAALLVAALGEMYAFFLLFGMLVVMASLLTRFSWKKCALLLAAGAALCLSGSLLMQIFGEGSRLSLQTVTDRLFAPHYASKEDLGRLTAIPTLMRTLVTQWPHRLLGLGLGNCDTSTVRLLCSDFYREYGYLHYTWFLSAFLFLETGFVGLGLYLAFFGNCLVQALKLRPGARTDPLLRSMGVMAAAVCLMMTFYNSALRAEGGYMLYFALALPFVRQQSGEGDGGYGESKSCGK